MQATLEVRPLVTVPEVAEWLRCSEKTAWRLLAAGHLARVKVGARTLVTRESVQVYIAQGGAV